MHSITARFAPCGSKPSFTAGVIFGNPSLSEGTSDCSSFLASPASDAAVGGFVPIESFETLLAILGPSIGLSVDVEEFPAMNSFLRARRLQSCKEVASTAIVTYIAPEMHGEEILPEGTDNPVGGVQIHDKYYCDICRIGFNERPEFARHRRFHRKTRSGGYRNRPPLTDGMIMKDGKYGCQFCPRVFDRLTSYTGHVRIHLRRNLKCSSTSIEAAPRAAHTYY
nr:methyl-cpg-binding domain-containing protein 8 [Ipomoea batatas]